MEPTIPITETINVVNRAAQFGPEMFIAVLVMVFCTICLIAILRVVSANTKAMTTLALGQAALCQDVAEHNTRTGRAVEEIHQIMPVIGRIDAGVQETGRKVDLMILRSGGAERNKL